MKINTLIVVIAVAAAACSTAALGSDVQAPAVEPNPTTGPLPPTTSTPAPTSSMAPTSTTAPSPPTTPPTSTSTTLPVPSATTVEIVDDVFHLGGSITNPDSRAEGLLMNSRMVQAIIDIGDEDTPFRYPDTGVWDAERNTDEFVAALPAYAEAGLDAVTINLQGGNPLAAPVDDRPEWTVSAFTSVGEFKADWADRLRRAVEAADDNGMAVILGLFYFGQDHRLADEAAIMAATDSVVDWVLESGHGNVLIEICNECNVNYDHAILRPDRTTELMKRVAERSGGTIPVSASLTGGNIPSNEWIEASDYILLHGNRQDAAGITRMVEELRRRPSFNSDPKPIVFNEDSTSLENLEAAVIAGAGWGYHDKGENDYLNGFQAPPVNWTIGTEAKTVFFETIRALTDPD